MPNPWKQKRSMIRHYDVMAETYDTQYREEQTRKISAALEVLPQAIDRNSIVLDIGCGTGALFPHLANKAKQVIGIDAALKLLRQGKTQGQADIGLIQADTDFLPLKTDTFTHAFAFTLLQNSPQPKHTIEEIKRVTRPDATLIMTGLKKSFTKAAFLELLENAHLEILTLRTEENLKDFVAVCRKRL